MKPTSAFKLSKPTKRMAATFADKHERRQYLKTMMEAQLVEQSAVRQPLKIKDSKDTE